VFSPTLFSHFSAKISTQIGSSGACLSVLPQVCLIVALSSRGNHCQSRTLHDNHALPASPARILLTADVNHIGGAKDRAAIEKAST
jgi:hypothetical protein